MLTEERMMRILAIVDSRGSVTLPELVSETGMSESTIRRDLGSLDQAGKLQRVRGGAVSKRPGTVVADALVDERQKQHIEEKDRVGHYAASFIKEDDFVYLDAGTTISRIIPYINGAMATFVTNAISHARELSARGYQVFLLGGEFKMATEAIVGEEAILSLAKYHFSKGFFGTNGITDTEGFTTPEVNEALVKQAAMESCAERFVLADASKFDQVAAIRFGEITDAVIISEGEVPAKYRKYCEIATEI